MKEIHTIKKKVKVPFTLKDGTKTYFVATKIIGDKRPTLTEWLEKEYKGTVNITEQLFIINLVRKIKAGEFRGL